MGRSTPSGDIFIVWRMNSSLTSAAEVNVVNKERKTTHALKASMIRASAVDRIAIGIGRKNGRERGGACRRIRG
jgi:hypothetical protein